MGRVCRPSQLMIAVLLALAVALVWPSAGPLASASDTHAHGAGATQTHVHSTHHSPVHRDTNDVHVGCEPSGIGCCMMTLCHPGVAMDPDAMPLKRMSDETENILALEALGNGPGVDLPPPRDLLG